MAGGVILGLGTLAALIVVLNSRKYQTAFTAPESQLGEFHELDERRQISEGNFTALSIAKFT